MTPGIFCAAVVIVPEELTLRTRAFPLSAMKTLPAESMSTLPGLVILAFVAGPPSPANPLEPLPAVVVIRDTTRYGLDGRFVPGPPLILTTHVPMVTGRIWKIACPCTSGRGDGSVSPGSLVVTETVPLAPGATLKKSSTA
jgi:hypothetical protein